MSTELKEEHWQTIRVGGGSQVSTITDCLKTIVISFFQYYKIAFLPFACLQIPKKASPAALVSHLQFKIAQFRKVPLPPRKKESIVQGSLFSTKIHRVAILSLFFSFLLKQCNYPVVLLNLSSHLPSFCTPTPNKLLLHCFSIQDVKKLNHFFNCPLQPSQETV